MLMLMLMLKNVDHSSFPLVHDITPGKGRGKGKDRERERKGGTWRERMVVE